MRSAKPRRSGPAAISRSAGARVVHGVSKKGSAPAMRQGPRRPRSRCPRRCRPRARRAPDRARRGRGAVCVAPRAFRMAISPRRCIVQTVKNAPITSAEMPKRRATISSSEPISERNAGRSVSDPSTDCDVVAASASATVQSASPVTRSTVAVSPPVRPCAPAYSASRRASCGRPGVWLYQSSPPIAVTVKTGVGDRHGVADRGMQLIGRRPRTARSARIRGRRAQCAVGRWRRSRPRPGCRRSRHAPATGPATVTDVDSRRVLPRLQLLRE